MRRRLAAILLLAVTAAQAQESGGEPAPSGYAFDRPRVLMQQRLLGQAHGVSLLVSACMDLPAHIDAALAAYAPWRERQEAAVALAQEELARHYFGPQAAAAHWADIVRALNLKNRLELAPDSAELDAACATLPQALRRPRYDLGEQFRLHGWLAELTAGVETELRWNGCRERLRNRDDDARRIVEARYEVWREINAERMTQAGAVLQDAWPVEAPAESLDAWLAELRRAIGVRGTAEDCLAFSESLKSPRTALRNVFAPPAARP